VHDGLRVLRTIASERMSVARRTSLMPRTSYRLRPE
jgi:hypothetical protein